MGTLPQRHRCWWNGLLLAGLGLAAAHCSRAEPSASEVRNVFGEDARVAVDASAAPWSAIVRLDSGCSGVLLAPNLVLSAAHCVVGSDGKPRAEAFTVRRDFAGGNARVVATATRAWYGTATADDDRSKDWAILQLAKPLAHVVGLPIDGGAMAAATLPARVALGGFSADRDEGRTLTADRACSVRTRRDGRLLHDCDATSGISGAPLLAEVSGETRIVGTTVSEYRQGASDSVHRDAYSDDYANVAIGADAYAEVAGALVRSVGQGGDTPELTGVPVVTAPSPAPDTLSWGEISSGTAPFFAGRHRFDVAINRVNAGNVVRVKLADACAASISVSVDALIGPSAPDWQRGDATPHAGAFAFRGESVRFVRLTYENTGASRNACSVQVEAARDAALSAPAAGPQPPWLPPGAQWYCQAAPGDEPLSGYFYWYHRDLDAARYKALALCSANFGPMCTSGCTARVP